LSLAGKGLRRYEGGISVLNVARPVRYYTTLFLEYHRITNSTQLVIRRYATRSALNQESIHEIVTFYLGYWLVIGQALPTLRCLYIELQTAQ
jgi:hypothetical protein